MSDTVSNLDPDNDCFLLVKFTGPNSAAFGLVPSNNLSPVQILLVAEYLRWQAELMLTEQYAKKYRPENEILVARGNRLAQ
jgi:hypothetical protein